MSLTKVIVGTALAAAATAAWPAPVGRVILSAGSTVAVREGREIRLGFGSSIEAKDVLRTGPASSLQVSFTDESIKSLRENSELAVDEYQFGGAEDGTEKAVFRLIKGGFRAVTGLIGRTRYANYSVRTPTATVGIRGTDYAVRDCRGDCGAEVKDGLYGSVLGISHGTNKVSLTNNAGEFTFGVNQHFHVADVNSAPLPLLQPPPFVSVKPQGKAQAGSGTGEESAAGGTGIEAESRPSVVSDISTPPPPPRSPGECADCVPPTPPPLTEQSVSSSSTSSSAANRPGFSVGTVTGLAALSATAIPHAPGSPSLHTVECDDSNSCSGGGADVITFDSSGYKRIDSAFGGFIDRNVATSSQVQSVPGVIEWGKWNGGPITAGGFYNNLTFGANQGFHYVVGVPPNPMPATGTATFSLLGATTPTFSDGVGGGLGSGTMSAGSATANFLSGTITANMSLAFNGTSGASNYALAMTSGSFSPGTAGLFGFGNLIFSSGAVNVCPSACSASFAGFFAGANASHLGLGYDATANSPNTFFINGVAVMGR